VGLPNFPVNVWLYALPLLVWPHLYAPTLFTGLLNSLAVLLTYLFGRRYWGHTAALTASFFFAVSPWAVMHSRKIWAQNLLPFFVLLWAISLALALLEGRQRWLAVAVLAGCWRSRFIWRRWRCSPSVG
jgi:4-amino-4-deoxy-L-arabinose transferase-like glycosyltransferase